MMDKTFPKFLKATTEEMSILSEEEHNELQRLSKKVGLKN